MRQACIDGRLDLDPDKLIFIDETGASTQMARLRGRSEGVGGEKDCVIGWKLIPRVISQPPAYVYRTRYAKWGLINTRHNGRPWSRPDMAKLLAASGKRAP